MAIDSLTANRIGGVGRALEPQRANNGLLYIVGLRGNVNDLVTFALSSFPIPKGTNNPIELPFLNETRKYLGKRVYDPMTVVFHDYVNADVHKVLAQWWYDTQHPKTGKMGLKANTAKQGRVELYWPDGSGTREYELEGIQLSQFDPGDIDMGTDDIVRINATFEVDKAYALFAL